MPIIRKHYQDHLIEKIDEASRSARNMYHIFIVFLVYCGLSAWSIDDQQLLFDQPLHLPIIETNLPLKIFFGVAPAILILIFGQLHLYIIKLNDLKSDPEFDGMETGAGKCKNLLFPWIVNDDAAEYDKRDDFIGRARHLFVNFSLWYALPTVLFIIAIKYVKTHEIVLSSFHAIYLLVGYLITREFRKEYTKHYPEKEWSLTLPRPLLFLNKKFNRASQEFETGCAYLYSCLLRLTVLAIIPVIILMPTNFIISLKPLICIDLNNEKLISDPTYTYKSHYLAKIKNQNLQKSIFRSAILRQASFCDTRLQNADLTNSTLDSALFDRCCLSETNFEHATLNWITIKDSNCRSTNFNYDSLRGARFDNTRLNRAYFRSTVMDSVIFCNHTSLNGADFWGADLENASLCSLNLSGIKLNFATLSESIFKFDTLDGGSIADNKSSPNCMYHSSFRKTDLSNSHLEKADLDCTIFDNAILKNAHLQNTSLRHASFVNANLTGTEFDGADLSYAKLEEAPTLKEEQLSKTYSLYKATLPQDLLSAIDKKYPELRKEHSDSVMRCSHICKK